MPAADYRRFLDARTLNKISRLELRARHIVEGFIAGMHKSPYHGFSVEFAEHREYAPGDDLRHLDWKVYGRSDRLMIKEYELETNLRTVILLDCSESMDYGSGDASRGEPNKFELACFSAAAMAYLILRQQDAVSLITFDRAQKVTVPPSNAMAHLQPVLATMAGEDNAAMARIAGRERGQGDRSDIGNVLHAAAEQLRHKGLVILISDLFDDRERTLNGLQHLRHRRHDCLVFHVLDEYELKFPFQRQTRFIGLEKWGQVQIDPRAIRAAYVDEFTKFCREVEAGCRQNMVDYVRLTTEYPLDSALAAYLAQRLGTKWKRR